ncbi:oxidoreductase [Fluctibacter halophilus]|nr:oxidoreductase [Aestuariibacter halophilus]
MTPIKVGLVGFGFSATTFHLPFLNALACFAVRGVMSSRPDDVRAVLPDVTVCDTIDALCENPDIELVVITAPNAHHYGLANTAIAAGKHVVVDKPFVTRSADGQALIDAAKQQGTVLSVFHNRRWDGDFLSVKQLLAEKRLGELRYMSSHFDRFRPQVRDRWRETDQDGGGILYDLGPHLIDQALVLFGYPQALTAHCETLRENGKTCDFFDVMLHYPGLKVRLHSSPFNAAPNPRFSLQGTLGSAVFTGLDPQEDQLKRGVLPGSAGWGEYPQEQFAQVYLSEQQQLLQPQSGDYAHYYRQLAEAIRLNEKPSVTASSALQSIQLLEYAVQSSNDGKTICF